MPGQEAWTKIWKAWGQADPDRLDAWTFRIVRNCCIDRLRQTDRSAVPLDLVDPAGPASVEADVVEHLEYDEILELLRSLPSPLRETIWLRETGGPRRAHRHRDVPPPQRPQEAVPHPRRR